MATDIVQTLFGVSPEAYQQKQADLAGQRALDMAQLDPFQRASYNIGRGAYQLAGALGGALGGQDPELQKRSQRQALLGMIDPTSPDSYAQAIQAALQAGDNEAAYALRGEMMKAAQRAQQAEQAQIDRSREAEDAAMKREDYLIKRGEGMKAGGLTNIANELIGQIKNADGSINEEVKAKLMSFPQGQAAIQQLAKIIPDLRRIGAAGGVEDDPFKVFTSDPTIPANVKTLATQYSTSLTRGILDPEKADAKVKELVDMTQRIQQYDQNQAQIKSNQALLDSYKQQGLQTSQGYLAIAQSNNALAQQNAAFEQQRKLDAAVAKKEEAANKPLRADLAKEEDADYVLAKDAKNLATDAYSYINRIKSGEIKFGLKDRASISARNLLGSQDPDVIARNDFDQFLIRLTNESLRLNKGTQTNFDYTNALKEIKSAESALDAARAMNKLAEVNLRRTEDAKTSVERRRANAGYKDVVVPIDVPKFEPHIITPSDYNSFLKNPKYPSGTIFVDPQGVRRVKP
jgi:hypothetical protein